MAGDSLEVGAAAIFDHVFWGFDGDRDGADTLGIISTDLKKRERSNQV